MSREERLQMRTNANGPDSRSTTAVRDTKCLVQVEMTDVGADGARVGQADLGVQVGAVEVDLTAVAVDDFAGLADAFFEYTKG